MHALVALLVSLVLVAGATGFAPAIAQDGHHGFVTKDDVVVPNPDHPNGTLGERGFKLRLFPQKPEVAVGGKVVVSAWVCPGHDTSPFGGADGDGKPGGDDTCRPIKVRWSVDGPATLANIHSLKTRLVLREDAAVRLTAEVDDLVRNASITIKDKPAANRGSDAAAIVKKAAQRRAKAAKVAAQKAAVRAAAANAAAAAAADAAGAARAASDAVAAKLAAQAEPAQAISPAAEEAAADPTDAAEPAAVEEPAAEESAPEPAEAPEEPAAAEPVVEPTDAVEEDTQAPLEEPASVNEPAPAEEPADEPEAAKPAVKEPAPAEEPADEEPKTDEPASADDPIAGPTQKSAVAEESVPANEPDAAETGIEPAPEAVEPTTEPTAEDDAELGDAEPAVETDAPSPETTEPTPSPEPVATEPMTDLAAPEAEPTAEPVVVEPIAEAATLAAEPDMTASQSTPTTADQGPTDKYIVTFKAGVGQTRRAGAVSTAGAGNDKAIGRLDMQLVDVPRSDRAEVIARLRADPTVESVDPNYARTVNAAANDPLYESQWHLPHIGWETLHGVKPIAGTATVAIIDTGVDASLVDLAGKLLPGATTDPHGHGTWMTSILAANTNNAQDLAGVAWTGVTVLPLTAIGADGVGYDVDIINRINDAVTAGVDVILMAFSGKNRSTALQTAIQSALDAGIIVVASVGNEGVTTPTYPAAYPGVIGVAATRKDDVVALWSDDGPSAYIAAPGVDIAALNPGGTNRTIRGTSAAAAQVAGAAALLIADGITSNNVAGRLSTSAAATNMAIGRLDLAAAFGVADVEDTPPGDDTGPDGDGYIVEPEPTPTPTPEPPPWTTPEGILGLDVSHWNGLPDFKALRAQGQRFVISKATQGTSFVDNTFQQHTSDAQAAGLLAGAYHFFDYRVDGTKQAQHFLSTVRKTSGLNRLLPLVVDVETLTSLGTPNRAQAKARLHAMLDELYRQTGRYPMIYTSRYMWEKVVGAPGGFGTYPLWVACWECDEMILPNGWSSWTFWQWGLARFDGGVKLDGNVYSAGMGQLNLELSRLMKLKNGAAWTGTRVVEADLRGFDGVQVRYAVGKGKFSTWQPYKRRFNVKLGRRQGNYDVRIQLRAPNKVKSPILRDGIKLDKVNPKLTRPRIGIRQGSRVAASGKRIPIRATISAKDARSGLKSATVRVTCGSKRLASKTGKGPLVTAGAPVALAGCSVQGLARDRAGRTAQKSIVPKLRIIDLRRGSKSVKLSGPWKATTNKDAVGKTLARSSAKGAQAKVTFKGQQFAVVVRRGPTGGRVKVIVDGKHVDTIDLYASQPDDRRIVYVRNVSKGKHAVKLRATGTASGKSSGTTVWLDAVVVLDKRK